MVQFGNSLSNAKMLSKNEDTTKVVCKFLTNQCKIFWEKLMIMKFPMRNLKKGEKKDN